MPKPMSRRRLLTMGAAATAGAALPLVPGASADAASGSRPTCHEPGRVLDVRSFGARGDGVTIDSDAVNRAIDEAAKAVPPGSRGPGGTVSFPAGTYACYSIRLKSNLTLYLGPGATLLVAAPARGHDHSRGQAPHHDFQPRRGGGCDPRPRRARSRLRRLGIRRRRTRARGSVRQESACARHLVAVHPCLLMARTSD